MFIHNIIMNIEQAPQITILIIYDEGQGMMKGAEIIINTEQEMMNNERRESYIYCFVNIKSFGMVNPY